ncbi:innexin inx2-like [Panulirus ornatus]|uniref:innexin inx2-like n=1 Tax=Panulirus ornatus TaxID=150431 RepID=UPI003A8B128B
MGVCIFLLTFSMIQCNWFLRESIYCVYNFNAKETVSFEIKNICLSYPYVCEIPETTTYEESDCPRRYILFYRWIHFTFLLTACAYYIPRMFSKKAENPRLKKLIVDLAKEEQRYDGSTWEQDTETMLNYMHGHISTHTMLYFWLVLCHVVALVIDVAVIFFFDFMLQGNFLRLVYLAYPFQRHPQNFTDKLSRTFPPFVHCKLDGSVLVNNAREDNIGCHLTLMELYEKVFIFLWIWLALITVCTAVSVLFLLLVTLPPFNRLFLCMHSSSKGIRNVKNKVLKLCGYADLYVLYLFKRHRSETQFIMFLTRFVHCAENKMLVGNDETNPSNLNKPANTDNGLDYPSNTKNEKFLNFNHTFPPDAHTSIDVSTPINKNILTGFSTGDHIRSRKFHASLSSPKVQLPSDCIEVH